VEREGLKKGSGRGTREGGKINLSLLIDNNLIVIFRSCSGTGHPIFFG
jgi:hypothetical protein